MLILHATMCPVDGSGGDQNGSLHGLDLQKNSVLYSTEDGTSGNGFKGTKQLTSFLK